MEAENKTLSGLEKMRRAWRFARDDVWDIELGSLPSLRRLGVKALRVVLLVFRGFREDECPLHASALTFSALMAIVPILALSLSLARGLGAAEAAKDRIRQAVYEWTATFADSPTGEGPRASEEAQPSEGKGTEGGAVSDLADRINKLVDEGFDKVESVNLTALSGVGLVLLLWMVIQVLGRVESSFNRVWGVVKGRSLWRRFADYLSVLVILPILVVAASSLEVASLATRFLNDSAAQQVGSFVAAPALKGLTVIVMTTLSFAFVLMFMPNTKGRPWPGLAGGLVAALLFLGWLRVCAGLQVGAARYGKLYGSFATVPILLAWVYVSWQIVLFGAEVAFAVQNCATYRMEQGAYRASVRARITLALSIVAAAARAKLSSGGHFDVAPYARKRRVPVRLLNEVVAELVAAGYLAELSEKEGSFALLKDPAALRVRDIIDKVVHSGVSTRELGLSTMEPDIEALVTRAVAGVNDSLHDMSVKDLLGSESTVTAA